MWQPQARLAQPRGQFFFSPVVAAAANPAAASGLGENSCETGPDNQQQQQSQQYRAPAVFTQNRPQQYMPGGTGVPGANNPHDNIMSKPPFPQQQGLPPTVPGQQTAMVFPSQHGPNLRPAHNSGNAPQQMQPTHGGQPFYQRGNNGGAGNSSVNQVVNQVPPRHVQQRSGNMNIPLSTMIPAQAPAPNAQQNFYGSSASSQVFIQSHMQPAVYYHQPMHHPPLTSTNFRYTTPQYQPQPQPSAMFIPQQSPQYNLSHPYPVNYMVNPNQSRSGLVTTVQQPSTQTTATLPKRPRQIIRIQDPNTKVDVTEDVLSNAGNNPTPPASAPSSARGTPPSNVTTPPPPPPVDNDVAAQFARQVAAAAASGAPPPPSVQTTSQLLITPQSSAVSSANISQHNQPSVNTAPIAGRTKSEKDFNNQSRTNVYSDKQQNVTSVISSDSQDSIKSLSKDSKPLPKPELEVTFINKMVEKTEAVLQPAVALPATQPLPVVTAVPSTRGNEMRDSVKKQDSTPPPPFPTKVLNAMEVNAPVAPFGALNPSLMSSADKISGTPPGSSQVIISAPSDHHPVREPATDHASVHPNQGVTTALKVTTPAPFTQQGTSQQGISNKPPLAPQAPFGQPPQALKQSNGEASSDLAKSNPVEIEVSTKDNKQPPQPLKKEVKVKADVKENNNRDVEEDVSSSPVTSAVDTPAMVIPTDRPAIEKTEKPSNMETDEGRVAEEILDNEVKRKVAEKNDENSNVSSMNVDNEQANNNNENVPSNKLSQFINRPQYKEGQWSPSNLDGKKQYDRDFLLKMQNQPPSLKKPAGLPNLEVIRDGVVNHALEPRVPMANLSRRNNPPDFFPSYAMNSKQTSRGRGSQQGRKEQPPQISKKILSISLQKEVELRGAEHPWVPSCKVKADDIDENKKVYKKVRALLNKLTPNNFTSLMEKVNSFGIDTEEKLIGVIDLVFEKAIDEPNFSVAYANMCKTLGSMKVHNVNGEEVNFKKLIIGRCQTEFEKDSNDELQREEKQKQIDQADPDKKKELQDEMQDAVAQCRRRSLGNIRFIGELYKIKILTVKIMHECVKKLLSQKDEDSLECLCRLLTTIGKDMEYSGTSNPVPVKSGSGANKPPEPDSRMKEYFREIDDIINKRQTSSRVRFMLLDVVDLRKNNWVPRREDNNPKTIDQIHREAEAEQQEKQLLYQTPLPKRNDDRMDRRNGPNTKRGANESEGWNTVGAGRKTSMAPMPDTSKCRMRMDNLDENNINLGPQTSNWSKGSMGGKSNHEGDRTPNRFSLLSNDHPQSDNRRNAPRHQQQSHSMSMRENNRPFMGSSVSQQLPPTNHRHAGGYKGSISREHEQAIANVKNLTLNDRISTSSTPSQKTSSNRSSSVTRAVEKVQAKPEMNIEQLETKIKNTIEEYLSVVDLNDAVLSVNEYVPADQLSYFVTYVFNQFLEKSSKARFQIGQLLSELVKKDRLSVDQFWKGMTEIFESAEDLAIDIPKFWEYLAEILAPLFLGRSLSLSNFKSSVDSLLNSAQLSILLANILKVMNDNLPGGVPELWQLSGLKLDQFVPSSDIDEYIKKYKLQFLFDEKNSRSPSINTTKHKLYDDIKQQLNKHYISTDSPTQKTKGQDNIYKWINENVSEKQRKEPAFIRALVTALAEHSTRRKENGSYEADVAVFEELACTVIKRYVDNQDKLELETLFAFQIYVHRLEHPQGLLHTFFNLLWNHEVISDDGFITWRNSEGQEVEGHAVAVKAVYSFLISLLQNCEEEEDANEEPDRS